MYWLWPEVKSNKVFVRIVFLQGNLGTCGGAGSASSGRSCSSVRTAKALATQPQVRRRKKHLRPHLGIELQDRDDLLLRRFPVRCLVVVAAFLCASQAQAHTRAQTQPTRAHVKTPQHRGGAHVKTPQHRRGADIDAGLLRHLLLVIVMCFTFC
jgi:hypothetical protein